MKELDDLSRRDFHLLVAGALGGAVVGSVLGRSAWAKTPEADDSQLLREPHVCCGLNTCKGHGAGSDNACAGQGTCATAERHGCNGANACAGQGGCGERPGENSCKGHGSCSVPLSKDTWKKARANFEAAMKGAGRSFGAAPAGCQGAA